MRFPSNHFVGGIDDDRVYEATDNFVKCRWQRRMVNGLPSFVRVRIGCLISVMPIHTCRCAYCIVESWQGKTPNEKCTPSTNNVSPSRCRYDHLFQCLHFSKILMLLSARLTTGQWKFLSKVIEQVVVRTLLYWS